jgi:hypothetical protein
MKENGREPGSPGGNSEAGRHKLRLVHGFGDGLDFPGGSDPIPNSRTSGPSSLRYSAPSA